MSPSASGRSPDAEPPVVAEGGDSNPQLRGYDANVFAAWFVIDDAAVERAARALCITHEDAWDPASKGATWYRILARDCLRAAGGEA